MAGGGFAANGTIFPRRPQRAWSRVARLIQEARDRQRRRRRWFAFLVLLAVLIGFGVDHWAGAGHAQLRRASEPAKVPNACTLLTTAQAVNLIGKKLAYRQPSVSRGVHTCIWSFMPYGNFTSAHPQVTMTVSAQTRSEFTHFAKKDGGPAVNGVGELAYWNGPNRPLTVLTVWDHGYVLDVFDSGTGALATEKAFAKLALKHLP
jgi:hypothetical protein